MRTIFYLLFALAIAVIVLAVAGCTTFYRDGKKVASFPADMQSSDFTLAADGSIRWRAAGVAPSLVSRGVGDAAAKTLGAGAVLAAPFSR